MSVRAVEIESEPRVGAFGSIPPPIEEGSPDYNLRILWPAARYIEEKHGADALASVAHAAKLRVDDFSGENRWVSWSQFETVLAATLRVVGSEEAFREACCYRMSETYGPLRYITWATTPGLMYVGAEKSGRFFSSVGEFKVMSRTEAKIVLRWTSTRRESRLICLSRHAQARMIPTLWGMPPAFLQERSCIARGDPYCEYEFSWFSRKRWLPGIVGLLVGAGAAAALHDHPSVLAASLPALGALLGYVYELRRTEFANNATREGVTDALRTLAADEAEARREILELHQRQRDWTRILEEEANERANALAQVTERVEALQQARTTTILGFSHDLRNPLMIMSASAEYLRGVEELDEEAQGAIADLEQGLDRTQRMLADLMKVATAQRHVLQLVPQRLEVATLVDRLRRRLKALVHGRSIRTTAFANREAPDAIDIDPLVLDRIIDNLLTNAAKYTDRGSIVVEVEGTPTSCILKVSDTGRGIEPDQLERTFQAGGSDETKRAANSYGVGLSVVVQLLKRIGGHLEVMSKPGKGTTFWVHLPLRHSPSGGTKPPEDDHAQNSDEDALSQVVRIRKASA